MEPDPRERRRHPRETLPIAASVLIGGKVLDLGVRDLSLGGIFLYTKHPPGGVGTKLTLRLSLAGTDPLVIQGEIVRIPLEPPERGSGILGIGLHFIENEEKREQLEKLLERGRAAVQVH